MPERFLDLPLEEQKLLLSAAEERLGFPDYIVEKDFWVCWILEQLFELPLQMVFKGGTSLSKAYQLIHRFSEDVDITIDYRNVLGETDLLKLSRTKQKQLGKDLKENLKNIVKNIIFPHLESTLPRGSEINVSDDGEKLYFYYPTLKKQIYLRDHVLLEFGIRNTTEPFENHKIEPYLKEILKETSITLPEALVHTLSPIRTFWEKATLIHVACNRNQFHESPERLSRHWYDLHMLYNSWVGQKAFDNIAILEDVITHKSIFFNSSYAHYDQCLAGQFKLIPEDSGSLQQDYHEMINSGMFHGEVPEFEFLVESLSLLESRLREELVLLKN